MSPSYFIFHNHSQNKSQFHLRRYLNLMGVASARWQNRKPQVFLPPKETPTQQQYTYQFPSWEIQKPVKRLLHPRWAVNQLHQSQQKNSCHPFSTVPPPGTAPPDWEKKKQLPAPKFPLWIEREDRTSQPIFWLGVGAAWGTSFFPEHLGEQMGPCIP